MEIDEISSAVVGESIRIHRELGPGLLESVYEKTLMAALVRRGMKVESQVPISIKYDGMVIDAAFRLDLFVEKRLVVEIKAVEQLTKLHARQVLTYLRLMEQPVGLLLNFSSLTMKEGIRRLVNNYQPEG
ncbi:MAG: GxxExxY protein [Novosphingobium sp.]|jgi:GxxExxY protein|nr:GxxExxY protein [Novosphingobium sp.]MBP6555361.1 GxxExxY protein [Novosphingobium sp.]